MGALAAIKECGEVREALGSTRTALEVEALAPPPGLPTSILQPKVEQVATTLAHLAEGLHVSLAQEAWADDGEHGAWEAAAAAVGDVLASLDALLACGAALAGQGSHFWTSAMQEPLEDLREDLGDVRENVVLMLDAGVRETLAARLQAAPPAPRG